MKSILDRSFKYTPSAQTDIRKLFARVRKQQNLPEAKPRAAVLPIVKVRK